MKSPLDLAVTREDERKKTDWAVVEAAYKHGVTDRLKPYLDAAQLGAKETREYSKTGLETVRDARVTRYATDRDIDNWCRQIEAAVESISTVERAVKEYKQLGPKNILLKNGEIGINRANEIFFAIRHQLLSGCGRRRGMERCVKQITTRIETLMAAEAYGNGQPVPVGIIPPDKPEPTPTSMIPTLTEFDARRDEF